MKTLYRFIFMALCCTAAVLAGCATVDLGPDDNAPQVRMPGQPSAAPADVPPVADTPLFVPAQTMPVAPPGSMAGPLPLPDDAADDGTAGGEAGGNVGGGPADGVAAPGVDAPEAPSANAHLVTLTTRPDGASAVPPTASPATAQLDMLYDTSTHLLRWKATWTGLSSPITAVRFHGPAAQGQQGPAALIWPGPFGPRYEGRATLTPQQATDLTGGLWYVNISTANYPDGEIRGQLRVVY